MASINAARWHTPASMRAQSAASMISGSNSSDQGRGAVPRSSKTLCVMPS
jgi:hypothetical protein